MWTTAVYDYLFLGVDTLVVGILYAVYKTRKEIIANIVKAPSATVGPELEKLLEEHGNNVDYIILKGKVEALEKPIQSQTGMQGVLQVVTLSEHSVKRHAFGQWGDDVRTLQKTLNAVPFGLRNLAKSGREIIVEVKNPLDAEGVNLLMPVATNFSPANSNIATAVVDFFTGHASKGFETTEKFLPVDTVVTGIGQVTRDSSGHIALIEPTQGDMFPYYLSTLPSENIVKRLERTNTYIKIGACLLATVGIIIAVRRITAWWQIQKLLFWIVDMLPFAQIAPLD
ncbi:unnamed protein product [Allacma fusca]|uniref:RING-type E3 ubiquitin transferase n=1 Tax=Allacma fusca TaxID=39272 RepID=A0A8J2PSU7_9HEXA|nr:unnamed protein product [Allacma fusca]